MRVSNISKFLGGADNVNAIDIIRGEQIIYTGTVRNSSGTAIDITNYTISAVAEFYTASTTIATNRSGSDSLTIDTFAAHTRADATIAAAKLSPQSSGQFTLTIPADLAADADTAALDASNVLVAVIYITYNDGETNATIRKSRLLAIIRHSA